MTKMKQLLFTIFFIITTFSLIMGQQNKVDSLLYELTLNKHDTLKIITFIEIGDAQEIDNPDSAIIYYQKAYKLADDVNHQVFKATALRYLGLLYSDLSDYENAIAYFLKSAEISRLSNNKKAIFSCFNLIGNSFRFQGKFDIALEYYLNSIKIAEELKDQKKEYKCLTNIGTIHNDLRNFSNAIDYNLKALKIIEELLLKTNSDFEKNDLLASQSNCYVNIGIAYSSEKENYNAIEYFMKAIVISEELSDLNGMSMIFNNIGVVYKNQKLYDKAIDYYLKSLALYEKAGNKTGIVTVWDNIAGLHIEKADSLKLIINDKNFHYLKGIDFALRALTLSQELNLMDRINTNAAHLKDAYKAIGNNAKALKYAELFMATNDSLFRSDKTKAITEMETKYQTEKKQKEIELLEKDKVLQNQEIEKQTVIRNAFIVGFGLVAILAIIILYSYRQKKKANKLLSLKNAEIEQKKEEIHAQNEKLLEINEEIKLQNEEINAQKELLLKMNTELEKLSIVASKTDNAVIIADSQGIIEWVNDAFTKLTGYNLVEFKNEVSPNLLTASSFDNFYEKYIECIENQTSVVYQSRMTTKYKNKVWTQTTLTPIFNQNNNLYKIITIDSDISEIKKAEAAIIKEQQKSESLLLNILPVKTADELKEKGKATPRYYNKASVLFTDFKGFTMSCENLSPEELVEKLHRYFEKFDEITTKYKLEKIKTIGDAYMCAGGIPDEDELHPIKMVLAALEIQEFMKKKNIEDEKLGKDTWKLRLGIHTGELITGVVGKKKFAYDVWGDTVNVASRMESSGEVGKVNISESTFNFIKEYFDCSNRGMIEAKNKGKITMYFVENIKPEFIDFCSKLNTLNVFL